MSDLIARAFFQASRAGDTTTAGHLLNGLESLTLRERAAFPHDRRQGAVPLDEAKALFALATTDITRRGAEHGQLM